MERLGAPNNSALKDYPSRWYGRLPRPEDTLEDVVESLFKVFDYCVRTAFKKWDEGDEDSARHFYGEAMGIRRTIAPLRLACFSMSGGCLNRAAKNVDFARLEQLGAIIPLGKPQTEILEGAYRSD
jgi:hypothetical protein